MELSIVDRVQCTLQISSFCMQPHCTYTHTRRTHSDNMMELHKLNKLTFCLHSKSFIQFLLCHCILDYEMGERKWERGWERWVYKRGHQSLMQIIISKIDNAQRFMFSFAFHFFYLPRSISLSAVSNNLVRYTESFFASIWCRDGYVRSWFDQNTRKYILWCVPYRRRCRDTNTYL